MIACAYIGCERPAAFLVAGRNFGLNRDVFVCTPHRTAAMRFLQNYYADPAAFFERVFGSEDPSPTAMAALNLILETLETTDIKKYAKKNPDIIRRVTEIPQDVDFEDVPEPLRSRAQAFIQRVRDL